MTEKAKNPNPFLLYNDRPGWEIASSEIQAVIDGFVAGLDGVMQKHRKFGAEDTASREKISIYTQKALAKLLGVWMPPEMKR